MGAAVVLESTEKQPVPAICAPQDVIGPACLDVGSTSAVTIGEVEEKAALMLDEDPDPTTGRYLVDLIIGYGKLGLDLDSSLAQNVVVREILKGPAEDSNLLSKKSKNIIRFDRLVAVNGVEGGSAEFARAIANSNRVIMCFQHPKEVKAELRKPGDVGISLNRSKNSVGLVILDIHDGLLKDWMQRQWTMPSIGSGDRIVAVNDTFGPADELLRLIQEASDTLVLTIMHYPA